MIEYIVGSETHSSNWGKFYVKGLEKYEVKEDNDANRRDGHHSYQFLMVPNAPTNTVFTIFEQSGNKHGTKEYTFILCAVDPNLDGRFVASYGDGLVTGGFYEIGRASGPIRVPRLMGWWDKRPTNGDLLAYAYHCAKHINIRGTMALPPMEMETKQKA